MNTQDNIYRSVTEQASLYRHLDQMSALELVKSINREDATVALAVQHCLPAIAALADAVAACLQKKGRLFYVGAGTSGRLGVLDASECPPTYGVPAETVVGIMAGGDMAFRTGIEDIEDSEMQGAADLLHYHITNNDIVIGLAASGRTPYVIGALKTARLHNIQTGCIVCSPGSPVAKHSDFPIEVVTGPELVTGSTRMKAGTAQKMVLNMISTTAMIRLGRVRDNFMVYMQLSNEKLMKRATHILMEQKNIINYETAKKILLQKGNLKDALESEAESKHV